MQGKPSYACATLLQEKVRRCVGRVGGDREIEVEHKFWRSLIPDGRTGRGTDGLPARDRYRARRIRSDFQRSGRERLATTRLRPGRVRAHDVRHRCSPRLRECVSIQAIQTGLVKLTEGMGGVGWRGTPVRGVLWCCARAWHVRCEIDGRR